MKSNEIAHAIGATKNNGGTKSKTNSSSTDSKKSNGVKKMLSEGDFRKHSPKEAHGLRGLFEDSLKDIYWAEKALVKVLPKMVKNASSEELVNAIEAHLSVTEQQVARLEEVFDILGKTARAKKCDAIEGLIKEGEGIVEETAAGVVRDAGIIMAGQKIEHYEIATYGTLHAFAKILGEFKAADLLEKSLNEEKEADRTLTNVAESSINIAAAEGESEREEDDVMENNAKIY